MRRNDREVTDFNRIVEIMKRCKVCHVAFHDDYPYVVPMNFGMSVDGEKIILYFHGAKVGRKQELIKKNNKVGFVMENMISVITSDTACESVAEFESVMGTGEIEYVSDEEKLDALGILMAQYASPNGKKIQFDDKHINATSVLRLKVNNLSAKRLIKIKEE